MAKTTTAAKTATRLYSALETYRTTQKAAGASLRDIDATVQAETGYHAKYIKDVCLKRRPISEKATAEVTAALETFLLKRSVTLLRTIRTVRGRKNYGNLATPVVAVRLGVSTRQASNIISGYSDAKPEYRREILNLISE